MQVVRLTNSKKYIRAPGAHYIVDMIVLNGHSLIKDKARARV
jgi:hypothetical protein